MKFLHIVILLVSTSCAKARLSGSSSAPPPQASPAATSEPVVGAMPTPPTAPQPVFKLATAALAIKQINCLMCHSTIVGNVMTDFNINQQPFNSYVADSAELLIGAASFRAFSYATANVKGSLIVPAAPVTDSVLKRFQDTAANNSIQSLTIVQALQTAFFRDSVNADFNLREFGYSGGIPLPVINPNHGAAPGIDALEEYKKLQINPPKEDEIRAKTAAATDKKVLLESGGEQIIAIGSSSNLTGFVFAQGAKSPYVVNSGASATCTGDIVITSTLVLDKLTDLKTSDGSCRIYTYGTILINRDLGVSDNGTLQLAAGRAVLGGISLGRGDAMPDSVYNEMLNVRSRTEESGFSSLVMTNSSASTDKYKEWNILAYTPLAFYRTEDGKHIHPEAENEMKAASDLYSDSGASLWQYVAGSTRPAPGSKCRFMGYNRDDNATSTSCYIREYPPVFSGRAARKVTYIPGNFNHVLIATPLFQTKLEGTITGTIVAGFALGILGEFKFVVDPRMATLKSTDVLPLLGREIVTIEK